MLSTVPDLEQCFAKARKVALLSIDGPCNGSSLDTVEQAAHNVRKLDFLLFLLF